MGAKEQSGGAPSHLETGTSVPPSLLLILLSASSFLTHRHLITAQGQLLHYRPHHAQVRLGGDQRNSHDTDSRSGRGQAGCGDDNKKQEERDAAG